MFGHDHKDENQQDNDLTIKPMPAAVNNGLLGIDDDSDASQDGGVGSNPPSAPPVNSSNTPFTSGPSQTADTPIQDTTPTPNTSLSDTSSIDSTGVDDDLLNIKREALEELSPLIDHLDQNPEEKFRTTMMMIQASDNKALVPQAFAAAKEITEDTKRAQALLDIVNEINYFTHQKND
jgi:hypothetical protein